MYCNNCGSLLAQEVSFCSACGSRQDQTQAGSQTPAEQAMYVFRAMRKFGMFKQETAYLVFFKDQLAVAHLSKEQQKQESSKLRQELKSQGVGYFSSVTATMGYWSQYGERYNKMGLPAILAENPANFTVPYMQINRFFFRGWSEHYDSTDDSTSTTKGKIQLQLAGAGKINFSHNSEGNPQLKQFFSSIFGSRLKYRR